MAAKTAVDTLCEKLQSGERGGSPADRDLLLAFSDELKLRREEYGWHRHEKLLRHNTRASENADVKLVESILSERDDELDGSRRVRRRQPLAGAAARRDYVVATEHQLGVLRVVVWVYAAIVIGPITKALVV